MMEGSDGGNSRLLYCFISCLFIFIQTNYAQEGFVSVRCCADSTFTDQNNITWITDENWFPDRSSCKDISRPVQNDTRYNKARVFGSHLGRKWCYNLKTTKDQDYLIRGTFLSGDQQATARASFGVSVDNTPIGLVNLLDDTEVEGIFKATDDYANFCLLKDKVDPYISKLELRLLNDSEYLKREPSCVLKLVHRVDVGSSGAEIRYTFPKASYLSTLTPIQ